jgi:regulator of cell morphogenesis and NO signaling
MTITETTTVAEIAAAMPASVRVFQRLGIDFCCGGHTPLGAACAERGVPFPEVAAALDAAATKPAANDRNWNVEPLDALIDHIVATYHQPLTAELPRLQAMAAKVARVHGAKVPHLDRVEAVVTELAAGLRAHMAKEEKGLFPAIRAMDAQHGLLRVSAPIAVMEQEHDHAGDLLLELRTITGGYAAPAGACETFRALYRGLAELECEMHVHVHLENNVLFPRALRQGTLTA